MKKIDKKIISKTPLALAADRNREKAKERSRKLSQQKAEIGELPPVKNPRRKKACRLDLLKFLVEYFPDTTGLSKFGSDHVRFIRRLQDAMLNGGRFANAVYRGAAKSTISENATIWATLYGHQRYVPIFSADSTLAIECVTSIKRELSENDLITGDFPEVCHSIMALGGKSQGARSQTYNGALTHVVWSTDTIVFPSITLARRMKEVPTDERKQTLPSGTKIAAFGMTGSIRGLKHKRADGTQQRPTFALVDDPQTDESAAVAAQVNKRMSLLRKTILRSAGHRSSLGCVVNGTIIKPRDMMHQLTDHGMNPDFQSERIPLVHKFADAHKTMWLGEYKRLRQTYDPEVIGDQSRAHSLANQFYMDNREAMDSGCVVSWDSCFNSLRGEISAIQHAYNILIDDGEEVFASECQQDPMEESEREGAVLLTPASIVSKLNRHERLIVPSSATVLTGMIDVHEDLLFWLVAGFGQDFSGDVVAYGSWPDQQAAYYTLGDTQRPLKDVYPAKSLEAMLWAGLDGCVEYLCGREWLRDDGSSMRIGRLLIDANWGKSTKTVYAFARQSAHSAVILPSHGMYVGASSRPMVEYTPKPGERYGPGWMIPVAGQHPVRHVTFDTNFWKSFAHNRLSTPFGQSGCVALFGENPRTHEMLADHFTAEYFVPTTAKGRVVDEWKLKAHNPDNHLFDCYVGTCVAASVEHCVLGEVGGEKGRRGKQTGKLRTLAEMMGQA